MGTRTYSLGNWFARLVGFILGFLFSNEIFGILTWASGYAQTEIPSTFTFLLAYGAEWAFVIALVFLMTIITLIVKFKLLTVIWWILLGVLAGIFLPILLPILKERASEMWGSILGR